MIHEHTDDLYTFEECKQELLEDGLIDENTPHQEICDTITDLGFNDCNNCGKWTGTLQLYWDCDWILKDDIGCVCCDCSEYVIKNAHEEGK